jgi:four helix bundle protein
VASLLRVHIVMSDVADQLKNRTMRFALDVCALIRGLPREEPGPTVKRQLAKSSTGLAFNYRATCRARSHTEFTARMGVVAEEADETQGWLEFIDAAQLLKSEALYGLIAESTELAAITSAAHGTARYNEQQKRRQKKA